jgi:hypothetical protein
MTGHQIRRNKKTAYGLFGIIMISKRRKTMSYLKSKNAERCIGLIREFVEGTPEGKKETAILALDQLQKICAGDDSSSEESIYASCMGRPIMFNS